MPDNEASAKPIVTQDILVPANDVIQHTVDATDHPEVLTGKLGKPDSPALTDLEIAAQTGDTPREISDRFALIRAMLLQADRILGTPLATISHRANLVIAAAAIDNRSGRRRAYTEDTLQALIRLHLAEPQHLPLIRAAGYAYPPPDHQPDLDLSAFIAVVADHMTKTDELQTTEQILQGAPPWADTFHNSPYLDPAQCINYHAPYPAGFARTLQPGPTLAPFRFTGTSSSATPSSASSIERDDPWTSTNWPNASTARWATPATPRASPRARSKTPSTPPTSSPGTGLPPAALRRGLETRQPVPTTHATRGIAQTIHDHLSERGPMTAREIRDTFGRNIPDGNVATGRTPDDLHRRFIRLRDRRIAALPFPATKTNPRHPIDVIPDVEPDHGPPITTIFESELHWLNRFAAHVTPLHHSGLLRVAITGSRAAAAAAARIPIEITIVVDDKAAIDLYEAVSATADRASQDVPHIRPSFSTVPHQQWRDRYQGSDPPPFHDIWRHPRLQPAATSDPPGLS